MGFEGIKIHISRDTVHLTNSRNGKLAAFFCGKTTSAILSFIPSVLALCPAAHMAALEASCKSKENQIISKETRIEAVLETLRFFSMDIRRILAFTPPDPNFLTDLGRCRTRLFSLLHKKEDTKLLSDTLELTKVWLEKEKPLFSALFNTLSTYKERPIEEKNLLKSIELENTSSIETLYKNTKIDPAFALSPTLNGHRIVGAIARRSVSDITVTLGDLFQSRIDEIRAFSQGKETQLGCVRTLSLASGGSASVVHTARGPLLYFVEKTEENINWINWIAPTEWVFQNKNPLLDMLSEAFRHGATKTQLQLMINAFDACTDVTVDLGETDA